jgi:hypothetical protein
MSGFERDLLHFSTLDLGEDVIGDVVHKNGERRHDAWHDSH